MHKLLLSAYRFTTNNFDQIQHSKLCGCCHCVQIFPADQIVGWTGLDMQNMDDPEAVARQTAMCPKCGSEAVLGDKAGYPITLQFLGMMNEAWYQQTLIRAPKPKT